MKPFFIALAFASIVSSTAVGQDRKVEPTAPLQVSMAAESPAPQAPASSDRERQVCKIITLTGSRLGGRKTCRTPAQWDAMRQIGRQETVKIQRPLWNCSVGVCGPAM